MKTDSTIIERYSLPLFIILTLVVSFAVPLFLSLPAEIVPLMVAIIPTLLATFLTALTDGGTGVRALLKKLFEWRVGFKWYIIALGLALGLRLTMSVMALLLGWIPSIQITPWSPPQFIIIGIFTLIGAVVEELGWRGYVLPKLLASRSALASALLIGIPWGVLHLSLILPGQMNAGTSWLGTILFLIGLSVALTWLYIQTRGSLVIVILFHAGQNYLVFLNGGIPIAQSLWLLTVVILALALVLIFLYGVNLQRNPVKETAVVEAA